MDLRSRQGAHREYISAYFDDEPMPGRIEISGDAVEQAIRAILGRRTDIVSINVTVWEMEAGPGLRIKAQPRKGAVPGELGGNRRSRQGDAGFVGCPRPGGCLPGGRCAVPVCAQRTGPMTGRRPEGAGG